MRRTLYTWLDIELVLDQERASGHWPSWLMSASIYYDDLVLRAKPGTDSKTINASLQEWFGERFQPGKGLILEGTPDRERVCHVEIEASDQYSLDLNAPVLQPTFRRVSVFPDTPDVEWPPPFPQSTPPIFAFYSFKGGVGRTTELLGCLSALAERSVPCKTLIVDADLEAPGITTLVEADKTVPAAAFSLVDFLALTHSDGSALHQHSLDIATYEIKRQRLYIPGKAESNFHHFLPAYRDILQSLRVDIRPEHLIAEPTTTWLIGDLFAALALRLEVDAVLIDLRAGMSELASPFLFDPRIRRVACIIARCSKLIERDTELSSRNRNLCSC